MYSYTDRVRYSETGMDCRMTIVSILNSFQDCSTFHSEDLGIGVFYLEENHLAWMLYSWNVVVKEYPVLGERIRIGTFPYSFKGFWGKRNFVMESADGSRTYAYADSTWVLLDTEKMKPTLPPQIMVDKYVLEEKLPMEYEARKITVPTEGNPGKSFRVMEEHLDSNNHVNNTQYVRMALRYLTDPDRIGGIHVEYKKQAHLGDVIRPMVARGKDSEYVSLCQEDGIPIAIMEFRQDIKNGGGK